MTERARTALRVGLFALLLWCPLPFGSVSSWAVLTLELWAAALGALALWVSWREPAALPRRARGVAVAFAAVVAVGLVQLLPLPEGLTRIVSPLTAETRASVLPTLGIAPGPGPSSLEPPATLDALLRLAAYGWIALAATVSLGETRHRAQAAAVLALSAAFQGLYGAAEYLSGHQHIFAYAKRYNLDEATGTFVNRNHYAGYLALTLPFALALLLDGWRRLPRAGSWRERIVGLAGGQGLRLAGGTLAAAFAWLGVMLSYSRAGLAVAMLATGVTALSSARHGKAVRLLVAVLLLPILFLLVQEVRIPGERFAAEQEELASLGGRTATWRGGGGRGAHNPILGTGLGTFEGAFALYRPSEIRLRWNHAHNDWLQALVEGGLPTLGALLVGAWLLARALRFDDPWSIAAAAGLAAIAVHGLVDFSLRIPAVPATAACIVGMALAASPRAARPALFARPFVRP